MRYISSEEFQNLKNGDHLITYYEGMADNEIADVTWSIYGNPDSNEILVVAQKADVIIAAASPSPLLSPSMHNLIFGIDEADMQLAEHMSKRIFEEKTNALTGQPLTQ